MRTLSILFLLIVFMTSIASAEVLTTANTLGKGKIAFLLAGVRDQNLQNQTNATSTSYGGYIGYGLHDDIDLFLQVGTAASDKLTGTVPGIGVTNVKAIGSGYQVAVKGRIFKEGEGLPVSVALAGMYKASLIKTQLSLTGATLTTVNATEISYGVGISKMIIPFVPYLGVVFRSGLSGGVEATHQLDLTLGTAIAWSMQGAVLIEYTNQSIVDLSGSTGNHTSAQAAIAVAYKI